VIPTHGRRFYVGEGTAPSNRPRLDQRPPLARSICRACPPDRHPLLVFTSSDYASNAPSLRILLLRPPGARAGLPGLVVWKTCESGVSC